MIWWPLRGQISSVISCFMGIYLQVLIKIKKMGSVLVYGRPHIGLHDLFKFCFMSICFLGKGLKNGIDFKLWHLGSHISDSINSKPMPFLKSLTQNFLWLITIKGQKRGPLSHILTKKSYAQISSINFVNAK